MERIGYTLCSIYIKVQFDSFLVYTALEWPEYGHYREFGADSIYKKMTMEQYKFAEEGRKKCLGY